MKKILFVVFTLLSIQAYAQPASIGTPNSAVPDAPAFRILSADPQKVCRPSSTREIAVGISDFLQGNGALPSSFFAEFSPFALLGSLDLKSYQNNSGDRFWYRTRLSFASRISDSITHVSHSSFGLRFTLFDAGDPRRNDSLIDFIKKQQQTDLDSIEPHLPSETEKTWGSKNSNLLRIDSAIVRAIQNYKNRQWNAELAEAGIAFRYVNADSLIQNIRIDAIALWLSTSFSIGQKGQAVISSSPTMLRGSTGKMDSTTADLSVRGYSGNNQFKLFLEGSFQGAWYKDISNVSQSSGNILGQMGGEYNVGGNVWVEGSAGATKDVTTSKGWQLVSAIKVKFGNGS